MNTDNSLGRHSGEGRYPAIKNSPRNAVGRTLVLQVGLKPDLQEALSLVDNLP